MQHAQVLFREKGDVRVVRDDRLRHRVAEHQPLHGPAFQDVLVHELRHVLRSQLLVEVPARVDDHDGPARAEAIAASLHHGHLAAVPGRRVPVGAGSRGVHVFYRHLVGEPLRGQLTHQGVADLLGPGRDAAGAEAHQQMHPVGFHARPPLPGVRASEGSLPMYTTYSDALFPARVLRNTWRAFFASSRP